MTAFDRAYTRAGDPSDLYLFASREDACAEWAGRAGAALGPLDAIRVLTHVRRRIACVYVQQLLVADVTHPDLLRHVGIDPEQLALLPQEVRWRVTGVVRRHPAIGGLQVPPLTRGASSALVVFAPFVRDHVEVVHAPVQDVTPPFPAAPARELKPDSVLIDLDQVRFNKPSGGQGSASSTGGA